MYEDLSIRGGGSVGDEPTKYLIAYS